MKTEHQFFIRPNIWGLLCGLTLAVAQFFTPAGVGTALAATTTVSDVASCQAFGGTVEPFNYCAKGTVTIATGDTLILTMPFVTTDLTNNGTVTNGPGSANLFINNLTNNAGATIDNYRNLRIQNSAVNHGNITVFAGNLSIGPFTNASTGRITLRSGTALAVSGELVNQGTILLDCGVPIFGGPITGNPVQYSRDCTPPVITPNVVGTLGNNGWYVSDVTVSWSVVDAESPISSQSGCDPVTVTSDTAGVTFTCTVTSIGGSNSQSVTIQRDATAPVVTISGVSDGALYTIGNVPAAGCSTSDTTSGVATQANLSSNGGNGDGTGTFTATCSGATDNAGNSAVQVNVTYTVNPPPDDTAPVIMPNVVGTLGNNGWYLSDVTVNWSVVDAESAISSQSGCETQNVTSDTSGVTFTCSATSSGGTASESVTIQRDATAPEVIVTGVSNGARYSLGNVPVAGCSTNDGGSGVVTQATLSITGGNPDSTGSFTATCSGATDNAGNSGSASLTYTVLYNWSGFFQPVDNLPVVNTVKAGQAIPVKFSLGGDFGLNIFAAGYPISQQVSCDGTGGSTSPIEETVTAGNSSLQYDPTTQSYTYVWKTDKGWAGTCRTLVVKLVDGSEQSAFFQFAAK